MDNKEKDLLDIAGMQLGEDLPDIDLDDISGVAFEPVRREQKKDGRVFTGIIQAVIRDLHILISGEDKSIRYPTSDRLKVIWKLIGIFITISAAESIAAKFLGTHGIKSAAELSVRVWTRHWVLEMVNSLHSAMLFLLDAKFISLVLGLVLLYLVVKRRRLV